MSEVEKQPRYQVGDEVRLIGGGRLVGRVTAVRGVNSPSGRILYRVHIPLDPEPLIWEVREDEIEKA
jgi:hypothetical protein